MTSRPAVARELFRPIATSYERWARWLSMGQDGRWRATMVDVLALDPGDRALDVAAGTGSITRLLQQAGCKVTSLDQSLEMITRATSRGAIGVLASGERLPFHEDAFDALTFGYLLRYVADVQDCLTELVRVVRPGGRVGMVEFGRPKGLWGLPWKLYTRGLLPGAGLVIGHGWREVGTFLGTSIEEFAASYPPATLIGMWQEAGLTDVRHRTLSLGGGVVMWGRKA